MRSRAWQNRDDRRKHLVLRSYLDAWLPIMSSANSRVLFIDGFAGPGEYAGGEEGSPQIALRALVDHSAAIKAKVAYFFIEKEAERAPALGTAAANATWRRPNGSSPHLARDRVQ
jgi:three-Cys-motif partner protein